MKLIVGNFKNKLDFDKTKTLLEKYQASFLHEKVGLCVKREYFGELNLNSYSNLIIYSNNIELKDINASVEGKFYLIGHNFFRENGENDALILKKTKRLLKHGANVLLCVGDCLDDFNSGLSNISLKKQLKGLKPCDRLVVAYEPVYAIGSATPALVDDVNKEINFIKSLFLGNVKVLYGGAINSENAKEFLNSPFIDGVLVGRACLNYNEFCSLVNVQKN